MALLSRFVSAGLIPTHPSQSDGTMSFIRAFIITALITFTSAAPAQNSKPSPNVLILLADDLGISESKDQRAAQPEIAARLTAKLAKLKKDLPADTGRRIPGGPGGGRLGMRGRPRGSVINQN